MTDNQVLEAMDLYGGSFIRALAVCYRYADDQNRATLQAAFPAYWAQYADLADRRRRVRRVRPEDVEVGE